MSVLEIEPSNRRQVDQFLSLPFRLYQNVPQWVPPLHLEARRWLDRDRNPFFRTSAAAFFIVTADSEVPIGRLAVLDNQEYNAYNREKTAFFYLFDCEDNYEAAESLFGAAFAWARQRGLDKIIGPKGFSPLDGMGLLVGGFEHRPALGIPYNLPYYAGMLEAIGFSGSGDVVSGYLSGQTRLPERVHQMAGLLQERRGLRIVRFRQRKDLRIILPKLKDLYNLSIEGTSGNYPLNDEQVKILADQILRFADPHLIKIVMKADQIVGFLFAYPDISGALQRTQGSLFPFGWVNLLLESRKTRWVNINGMGMLREYRGAGGTALLFSEIEKSIRMHGFEHAELVQIGAENDRMLRELRSVGVDYYKKHRMYEYQLE